MKQTYFNIGDRIKIVPNTDVFTDSEIVMRVIGYNHYKLSDGSGEFAGVVFDMVGVMNNPSRYIVGYNGATNEGGWPITYIRSYLNDTIFPQLHQKWKTLIKEVEVLSGTGGSNTDIATSNDKLFVLSVAELITSENIMPYKNEIDSEAEEITFSVFTDDNSRIKKLFNAEGAVATRYLSRTTVFGQEKQWRVILSYGAAGSYQDGQDNTGTYISIACCM